MAEVFNPLLYGHPVLDYNFRTISRILYNITSGEGIPTTRITDDAIDGTKIADASVDTEHIVADAVTAAKIEALTITAAEIAANTITASQIAANTITASEIAASTITASELNVSTLSAISANVGTLTAGTITTGLGISGLLRTVIDYTVSTDCTNFTISSLLGDTDEEWHIHCLWKKNGTGAANFGIQPNADTGANYGFRTMYGAGAEGAAVTTWSNAAYTYLWMGRADTDHYYSQGYGRMNTKSGHPRQLTGLMSRDLTGATIGGIYTMTDVWNNTADQIISLLFLCSAASGIHAGSRAFMYKRVV